MLLTVVRAGRCVLRAWAPALARAGRPQVHLLNRCPTSERIERLAKKYIKLVPPHAQQLVLLDEVTERDFQHDGGREAAKPIKSAAVAQ